MDKIVNAYAAKKAGTKLEHFSYKAKELGLLDVEIKITHCGICHSDIHLINGDWGDYFPIVPGHEIIGNVSALGKNVKDLKMGERVGVGWQAGSCMKCEYCLKGEENLCPEEKATCQGNHGGYADSIRVDSRFAFSIPEELKSENAAPLMCGGITVYSPIFRYAKPGMKVGVIGIGGLGHLAVQFAKALGCEVTAFSTSEDKEQEARKLGASKFILSTDSEQMKKVEDTLDFILSTVNVTVDYAQYFKILRKNGNYCQVGALSKPFEIPSNQVIVNQKSLTGSLTGNCKTIREMLEFCAQHNISAKTQAMPMSEANEGIEKVKKNKARYRIVLKN
ncbi:MAG: NAD(P)-dependent alcohol dehydrogenase [Nanoarchaeota archaeon]